jgi:hypothetical protein
MAGLGWATLVSAERPLSGGVINSYEDSVYLGERSQSCHERWQTSFWHARLPPVPEQLNISRNRPPNPWRMLGPLTTTLATSSPHQVDADLAYSERYLRMSFRQSIIVSSLLIASLVLLPVHGAEQSSEQQAIIDQMQLTAPEEAANYLYTLDTEMQSSYAKTQYATGQMQSPVILAMFNGTGGRYILRRNGKQEAVEPVPALYQQMKSVSHTLVGIFEIISPYFEDSQTGNWQHSLAEYDRQMKEALARLSNVGMPTEYERYCQNILEGGIAFMDKALKTGTFTAADYSAYAKALMPDVYKTISLAGKLQVDHFQTVVKKWRQDMGEEEWSRLYTVVNTAWAMRRENVHFQIMAQMMGRDAINDRLILAEAINNVTEDDLLMLLGRIVNDRVLSILVFDKTYRMDVELIGEAARAATESASCPQYPAIDLEWMPYEQHKMPNEE